MPVPQLSSPQGRPSGMVRPDLDERGVTEIRVHGVGGATPESQLGDLSPQQVAGDRLAGFYRTADAQSRHVEAYSWGGLTSRSGTRVLWLLLLPFMLANLAGWMAPQAVMRSGRWAVLHRWTTRWVALAVTLNVFLIAAIGTLDILAYQCGGQPSCAGNRWWLTPFTWADGLAHPGRRLVIGALPLLLGALALAAVTYLSRSRYEAIAPPYRGSTPEQPPSRSAAASERGLADPHFWHGHRATTRLGRCHLAGVLAFIALAVLWTVRHTMRAAGSSDELSILWVLGMALAGVALLATAALLAREEAPDWSGRAVVGLAAVAVLVAGAYGWWQPAAPSPAEPLPGMRPFINATYAVVLLSLVPAFYLAVRAAFRRRGSNDEGTFPWGAPLIVGALAVMLLNTVLIGVLIRVAAFAGEVWYDVAGWRQALDDDAGQVFVYPMIAKAAPYLTLVPIAIWLGFLALEGVRYWAAGRRSALDDIAAEYRAGLDREPTPPPSPERPKVWYDSVFAEPAGAAAAEPLARDRPTAEREQLRFAARVARSRWLATANTHLGWLLVLLVVVGVVLLVWIELLVWRPPYGGPWAPDWFIDLGTQVAGLLPLLLLALVRWAWSRPQGRKLIGVLWDVGTFWPRAYHPWAPPSYAERAVPELQRRIWWLHDSEGQVLVAAHSQGTIVAAAALLQEDRRPPDAAVSLVTFGSPLRTLYRWAFPSYFGSDVLARLGSGSRLTDWRNFYYRTDFVGGSVLPTQAGNSVDRELSDPAGTWHVYGQPAQPFRRHTGYWTDRRMWAEIDAMAAELAARCAPAARTYGAAPEQDRAEPAPAERASDRTYGAAPEEDGARPEPAERAPDRRRVGQHAS